MPYGRCTTTERASKLTSIGVVAPRLPVSSEANEMYRTPAYPAAVLIVMMSLQAVDGGGGGGGGEDPRLGAHAQYSKHDRESKVGEATMHLGG